MSGYGFRRDIANSRLDIEVAGSDVLQATPTALTIPSGVTSGLTVVAGGLTVTAGGVTLSDGSIVYENYVAVTQLTDHGTTVICSALSGIITLASVDLVAGAQDVFTVTNTFVAVGDVVLLHIGNYADAEGTGTATVHDVASGSFKVWLDNSHASEAGFNNATTLNFVVIQANA